MEIIGKCQDMVTILKLTLAQLENLGKGTG